MPATDALAAVAGWLVCPLCGTSLGLGGAALACGNGHAFDVARQGYVNLLGHAPPHNADTAAMCDARAGFLASGHYDPIREAVARLSGEAGRLLEVGAGTGWYLAGVLDQIPGALGLATDVSVPACKRAAKAHAGAAAVVADTWAGLPLRDGAVDAVLCVFAPRNAAEFARVLGPGGRLVVVVPGEEHLIQLRDRLGLIGVARDKLVSVTESLRDGFTLLGTHRIRHDMTLTGPEATALVAMGPNAFHGAHEALEGGGATLDVTVAAFVRR